jgi:hypothetical protein
VIARLIRQVVWESQVVRHRSGVDSAGLVKEVHKVIPETYAGRRAHSCWLR